MAERLVLTGPLDENARLTDRADQMPGDRVDIDLAGVTYINSLGVRDWIRLLRKLSARGVAIQLHRCSEPMVAQMNMILDARGGAEVVSVAAPFRCDGCGWEGNHVVEIAAVAPLVADGRAPQAPCPECKHAAVFADHVGSYFLFLE